MAGLFDDSQEDKTESPSSYRREEFRKKGTVALSREVLAIGCLFASGIAMIAGSSSILKGFGELSQSFFKFGRIEDFSKQQIVQILIVAEKALAWMVLPVAGAVMVAGLVISLAQVGFYVSWEPLTPNFERINPLKGVQRLLSLDGAMEAVKAMFKIVIAGFVVWIFLKNQAPSAALGLEHSPAEIARDVLGRGGKLFFTLLLSLSVMGILDYALQRYRVEKQLKTSRKEARDEFKLREGDPMIKARIRGIQRKMASKRMMEAVPKADVVVTNPTHLAVALKYDPMTMASPKVVAKGADHVAKKIRELARANGVPLVENKPLARTLYKEIEVGHPVTRELYKAVAQVLAYVYRLKRGAQAAAGATV